MLEPMNVTVAVVNSRAEAELIAGMLRNNGIEAYVSADDLGGVDLALQAQGVRIIVSETDKQSAKELLAHSTPVMSKSKPPNAFQKWLFTLLGGNK